MDCSARSAIASVGAYSRSLTLLKHAVSQPSGWRDVATRCSPDQAVRTVIPKPERVLVPLPDGRWLALASDVFLEALAAGATVVPAPISSCPTTGSEQLLDAEELAKLLSLPASWIEQAARERRIPSVQAGRWRRFSRFAVEQALLVDCAAQKPNRR